MSRTAKLCTWGTLLIMVAVFFPIHTTDWGRAHHFAARAQISAYMQALENYKKETGDYPSTSQGLQALRTNPGVVHWHGPYVEKDIGPDPWGHPYLYRYRAGEVPEILSLGVQGRPGPSNISNLVPDARQPAASRLIALFRTGGLLILALVLLFAPFLPGLLRQ